METEKSKEKAPQKKTEAKTTPKVDKVNAKSPKNSETLLQPNQADTEHKSKLDKSGSDKQQAPYRKHNKNRLPLAVGGPICYNKHTRSPIPAWSSPQVR